MKQLLKQLDELKQNYNVVGIKQSFEDEGVLLDDVVTIRRITELCDLPTFVKIGGCEAKTDINNCIRLGIDNIIAPMVETPFALSKFIHCVSENENVNLMFVCESTTSHSNIKAMLDSPEASRLKGIVIGRSDLTKSFGLNKSEVDSEFISNVTKEILQEAKKHNLITTMGGNVSVKSAEFIKQMFNEGLLDKIETRNIVIQLTKENVDTLDNIIRQALNFEIDWLKYKSKLYLSISTEYISRANLLENRKF